MNEIDEAFYSWIKGYSMNEIDEAFYSWIIVNGNVLPLDRYPSDVKVDVLVNDMRIAFNAGYKAAKERPSTTITTADAARELGTSPEYVQRLISSRKIEAVMVGRILNVNRESLDHYKNNRPKRGPKKKV